MYILESVCLSVLARFCFSPAHELAKPPSVSNLHTPGERLTSLRLRYCIDLLQAVPFYVAVEKTTHIGIYLVSRAALNFRRPLFMRHPGDTSFLRSCEDNCHCKPLHPHPAVRAD